MKILYFGTVCDLVNYEKLLEGCKRKPTVATIVFESALLKGMHDNGAEIDILTYPMIPNFRQSGLLYWGRKTEALDCGYTCSWLRTLNVVLLKQLSRRLDGRRAMIEWLKKNRGEDCRILTYGISPFLAGDIVSLCKKYGVKCCAIVPDLPRDMFINSSAHSVKSWLRQQYLKPTLKVQGEFDSYVYLTKAMADVINPDKPYIVVEGILNDDGAVTCDETERSKPRAIMYAGVLAEKNGILNLIEAFEKAAVENSELWIFGDGNVADRVREYQENNPAVKMFGRVSREEVIEYEKRASLLVNPRGDDDEYTKYSFPSKTIEYMNSGTPLLTTKLPGIPEEYFQYVFSVENNSVSALAEAIKEILSQPEADLLEKGSEARKFVNDQKNALKQSRRILDFLMQ